MFNVQYEKKSKVNPQMYIFPAKTPPSFQLFKLKLKKVLSQIDEVMHA